MCVEALGFRLAEAAPWKFTGGQAGSACPIHAASVTASTANILTHGCGVVSHSDKQFLLSLRETGTCANVS